VTIISSLFLDPTENLDKNLLSIVAYIIIFGASITTTNNNGDNGSLYLNPHKLLKKPEEEPLMRMESQTVEMQYAIQCLHLPPTPHLFNKYSKNSKLP